jgi:hypothetical protein
MTVHFDEAAGNELLPGDSQTIHIRRNDVILPSGETGVTEYASHGTGLGVVIIPMTVGGHRLLTRKFRHPIDSLVWEFPRAIVSKVSVSEAERCLLESTGLQATCRMIGSIASDSGALNTRYGVYEAFVDADALDGHLPEITSGPNYETEWFPEDRFAILVRDSEVNDGITLAAIAMQSIETLTSTF